MPDLSLDLTHWATYLGTAVASAGSTWFGMFRDIRDLKRRVASLEAIRANETKGVDALQNERLNALAAEVADIRAGTSELHARVGDLEEEGEAPAPMRLPMPSISDEDLAAKVERFVTKRLRSLWAEVRELQRELNSFRKESEAQRTANAENWASMKANVVSFEKQLERILDHILAGR